MKKLLLMFVALFAMGGVTVSAAEDIIIDFANTQEWWGATYDSETQSMICTAEYKGLSWYWWDGRSTADYDEFQIVVNSEVAGTLQVVVQYLNDDEDNTHSNSEAYSVTAGEEITLTCPIEKEMEAFQQIALQGGEGFVGTVKLISAVVKAVPDEDHSGNDYDELPLDNDYDLSAGWSSSYNGATHTITYESAYSGRGWWFGNPEGKDCTAYEGVEVVLKTELTGSISLTAQYNYFEEGSEDGLTTSASITGSGSSEEQTVYCAFDETMKDNVMQIWIQSAQAGDIVLVSAKLIKESSGDEGDGDSKFECDGLYYEVLYEDVTDDEGNVVGTTPTDNVQIISPEAYEEGLGVYTITKLSIPATATNGSKTYNVTRIGTSAFASSAVEDLVTIPANIVSTGTSSFDSCYGIIRVTFEEGEDLYDDNDSNGTEGWMFGNCPHIDIVTVNRDIYCGSTTRLCAPFTYNTSITTIFIGENVTRVPAYMFRNTTNGALTTVTIYAETPIDWRYDPFSNKTGNKIPVLYVHEDAIEAYEAAAGTDGVAYADIFEQILPIEGVEEGITNVEAETSAKVTGIYNLAGQRVSENAKGIVIKDGKKVLVK